MQDKRAWNRIPVGLNGKCRFKDESRYVLVRITDIHHHGCSFKSEVEFKPGQEVRMLVEIPIDGELYMTGRTVWAYYNQTQGEHRAGVNFVLNSPQDEENCSKLYRFCGAGA